MSTFRQKLGPALVAEGVITPEQLMEAQTLHKRHPHLPISQIVSIVYRIPAETIDAINLRSVVLPGFESLLRRRLTEIAATDRFARDFHIESYITSVNAHPASVETRSVQMRRYEQRNAKLEPQEAKGFINTLATLEICVKTSTGDTVMGKVNVRHDTQTKTLVIVENDAELKNALYYGLRESYKKTVENQ